MRVQIDNDDGFVDGGVVVLVGATSVGLDRRVGPKVGLTTWRSRSIGGGTTLTVQGIEGGAHPFLGGEGSFGGGLGGLGKRQALIVLIGRTLFGVGDLLRVLLSRGGVERGLWCHWQGGGDARK